MFRLRAEIGGLSRQVRAEMRKIISSLQGQVDVASARLASLKASLDRVKVTAEQANEQRVRLKALEREASASSQLLETYLGRFGEASARADIATQSPNARIISKAYVASTPSYPKKGPILILLTLGALVLGVTIAFLLELFSATPAEKSAEITKTASLAENKLQMGQADIRAFDEVRTTIKSEPSPSFEKASATMNKQETEKASIQVSIVAELPVILHDNPGQIEIEKVLKGLILDDESYRQGIVSMQSFVSQSTPSGRGRKILAMSNMHNFDKSMAALALTRKLSAEGQSVLLIDADFQMQNLSRSLNLMAFDGMTDLITGAAQFSDVVIQDTHSSAHIISAGERVEFQDEDDVDARLEAVVDAFAHAYDYTIVDGGMAYPGAPMWSLIASSDCTIVFMASSEIEDVVSDLATQIYERSPEGALGIISIEAKSSIDVLKSMKLFRHDTAA
jgi:tyrosine-protein kinase Etk/Wzc